MNLKPQLPISEPALSWFLQCCKNARIELAYGSKSKRSLGFFQSVSKSQTGLTGKIHLYSQSNPHRLLFTAIHELSHAIVWLDFDGVVAPHGSEWKAVFTELLEFALHYKFFPEALETPIRTHIQSTVFACSGTDLQLELAFRTYDSHQKPIVLDVPMGSVFQMQGRQFVKVRKLNKRFECKELQTNRLFRVHPLAEIQPISDLF